VKDVIDKYLWFNMLAMDEVIKLYQKDGGFVRVFSKIRFWDAPYSIVERIVPEKGNIVEIGCGEGIFTNYLGITSQKRDILGIEINRKRLGKANRGIRNVKFKYGDATKVKLPRADSIILFHLLHHLLSFSDQEKVIRKCLLALKPGGKLIIVEVDKKFSLKYLFTWLTDHFFVPWVFEGRFYSPIFFRSGKDWLSVLNNLGMKCKARSAEKGMPFTHIIISGVKY